MDLLDLVVNVLDQDLAVQVVVDLVIHHHQDMDSDHMDQWDHHLQDMDIISKI